MNGACELLEAGAVLPAGTENAGENAVPLTARRYRHPALDGRVVVRLAAADLGQGEDTAANFLGMEREGEPVVVGLGRRGSLGFPEWVLVHRPQDGHHALDVVPELERIAARAKVKPKAALDAFKELAGRLASSVPHLLPTFYERAARAFLAVGNPAYAGQLFDRARKAEAEHALPIDEERLDAVLLEFTLAGALTVKALCAYGRELSHRVSADEALRRFTGLCVRRTAAGLEPSPQVAPELRRLAKAAGTDVQTAEGAYLTELLALPVTVNAAAGWWNAHRQALIVLAKERPEIRGALLNMEPADREAAGLWLELLEESGAVVALLDPGSVPEEARPEGGSVGWLDRFVNCFWGREAYGAPVPALYGLVERMADRLKAELAARDEKLAPPSHVDLLDLLLELGVPVADPDPGHRLRLENWAAAGERRDLLALAADPRFVDCFHQNAEWLGEFEKGVFRTLAASPGGRPLLASWVTSAARQSIVPELPDLPESLDQLSWLPGEVLALAEDAVRETAATDLAPILVRALHTGLFDELGRPAWEEALRRIDRETAAELLKAASNEEDLAEAVRTLLPDVTHEALIAGIAEVVGFAAQQRATLDAAVRRMEAASRKKKVADPSDKLVNTAAEGLGYGKVYLYGDEKTRALRGLRKTALFMAAGDLDEDSLPALHLDGPELPETTVAIPAMVSGVRSVAYRAVSALNAAENREALAALLSVFGELGLIGDAERHARWRRFELHLDRDVVEPYGKERVSNGNGLLTMKDSAFMAVVDHGITYYSENFHGLFYDPSGRFELPADYEVFSSESISELEDALLAPRLLAEAAERGPAPWFPEAAEEFARLTGVTLTMAKLVVAGLPHIENQEHDFLPSEMREALGVKVADAAAAKEELRSLDAGVRRALVGALVPSEPSGLWTGGPDAAAAAEVWNAEVGRRVAVPEELMAEAVKEVRIDWMHGQAMSALLDPLSAPELSRDVEWSVQGDRAAPAEGEEPGFSTDTLVGAAAMTAWLAHRLPAGDPLRERLPAALAAVRDRLANPGLLLPLAEYVDLDEFRREAGAPLEEEEDFERYGALLMPTDDDRPQPAIDPARLDEPGSDAYLAVLRGIPVQVPAVERAVRLVRDERFAALLTDPGDPVAGERSADGTWWPQDPSRSVPDLVVEAAERYGSSPDAATVYLMLLAMPDPTDKNTARWTGWKPARLKAARAELAEGDLVVEARRSRAGRSLFLPGGWTGLPTPYPPLEEWKLPLLPLADAAKASTPLGVVVPTEPVADLYRRAWLRVIEGDGPRFADLEVSRGRSR